jgi:hypothetical protein
MLNDMVKNINITKGKQFQLECKVDTASKY